MNIRLLLTETAQEKTLEDVFAKLEVISSEVSGMKSRIVTLESDLSLLRSELSEKLEFMQLALSDKLDSLQTALVDKLELLRADVAEKLDLMLEKAELMPQAEQVDYIVAFLFMLVCFELMRLVRNWTKWYRKGKGGD